MSELFPRGQGAFIATYTTADTTAPNEPPPNAVEVRDDLVAQLSGAQADLSAQLIELRQSGASPNLVSQGEVQLAVLMALKGKLERASPSSIAAIQSDIAACVAVAAGIAQQAQTAATGGNHALNQQSLATSSAASRTAVASFAKDYYETKVFDPYLHFSSAEEEQEFRRREAERKEEIERAQALQTPEGNLRSNTLAIDQLDDAGAHGAYKSPDFAAARKTLLYTRDSLRTSLQGQAAQPKPDDRLADAGSMPASDTATPAISPDVLAALRAVSGNTEASGSGHGLSANALPPSEQSRTH